MPVWQHYIFCHTLQLATPFLDRAVKIVFRVKINNAAIFCRSKSIMVCTLEETSIHLER